MSERPRRLIALTDEQLEAQASRPEPPAPAAAPPTRTSQDAEDDGHSYVYPRSTVRPNAWGTVGDMAASMERLRQLGAESMISWGDAAREMGRITGVDLGHDDGTTGEIFLVPGRLASEVPISAPLLHGHRPAVIALDEAREPVDDETWERAFERRPGAPQGLLTDRMREELSRSLGRARRACYGQPATDAGHEWSRRSENTYTQECGACGLVRRAPVDPLYCPSSTDQRHHYWRRGNLPLDTCACGASVCADAAHEWEYQIDTSGPQQLCRRCGKREARPAATLRELGQGPETVDAWSNCVPPMSVGFYHRQHQWTRVSPFLRECSICGAFCR